MNTKLLIKRIFMKAFAVTLKNNTDSVKTVRIVYGWDVIDALNKVRNSSVTVTAVHRV